MNWIIQANYNEHEELSQRDDLTEYEKHRLEQLESEIFYYESSFGNKKGA